jgi:hypothetical protein
MISITYARGCDIVICWIDWWTTRANMKRWV